MKPPSQAQIEAATVAWMAKFRQLWAREYPDRPCPLLTFEELNGAGRLILMGSMRMAIAAANDPKTVERIQARMEEQAQ
jgi:hypothetical protein